MKNISYGCFILFTIYIIWYIIYKYEKSDYFHEKNCYARNFYGVELNNVFDRKFVSADDNPRSKDGACEYLFARNPHHLFARRGVRSYRGKNVARSYVCRKRFSFDVFVYGRCDSYGYLLPSHIHRLPENIFDGGEHRCGDRTQYCAKRRFRYHFQNAVDVFLYALPCAYRHTFRCDSRGGSNGDIQKSASKRI